jgi:hypothetical protein
MSGPGAPFRGPWAPRQPWQQSGTPPRPLTLADLYRTANDPYSSDNRPGVLITFTDGSQVWFPGLNDDDWDYAQGCLYVQEKELEHTWPLSAIFYVRQVKGPETARR